MDRITNVQAYNAMTRFLVLYYQKTKSGYIGSLLGDLQFFADKQTANPAAWTTWLQTINNHDTVTPKQTYKYMISFIKKDFYYEEETDDCKTFWNYVTPVNDNIPPKADLEWDKAVEFVLTNEDSRQYIQWQK